MLMREIKNDLHKWRDILCLWSGRFKIGKIPVLPTLIGKFNIIPIRIPAGFFGRYREDDSKIYMEFIARIILEKNKVGGSTPSNFKTIYKATVIKIMLHWQTQEIRSMVQNKEPRNRPAKSKPVN